MKNRVLSFLTALFFVLSTVFTQTSYADTTQTLQRDTVLVVDVSLSMAWDPFWAMAASIKKFYESNMNSKGDNRISIVAYAENVKYCLELTEVNEENKPKVFEFIRRLGIDPYTNIHAGLLKADEILKNNSRPNAVKNIILLTDGIPSSGFMTDESGYTDKYNGFEASKYNRDLPKFAGGLNKFFNEELNDKYNVYTLGFFHSSNDWDKEFGKVLLSDIQNKGYYEVTDPEKLDFTFGEISDEVLKGNDDCPIIIVPGVMGSRLFDKDGMQWWDPKTGFLNILKWGRKLDDNLNIDSRLYVHGNYDKRNKPVNQALLPVDSREFGAAGTYKVLLNSVIDEFNNSTGSSRAVYFFSYDFRQDNALTAKLLSQFIEDVLAENKEFSQVDIVAHSMGGLVSSKYVKDKGMGRVRRLVTLSTPYEGAPKLIQSVLTETVTDSNKSNLGLSLWGNLNTKIKAAFPAIAQLVPNETYFNSTVGTKGESAIFRYAYNMYTFDSMLNEMYEPDNIGMNLDIYNIINSNIFKENFNKAKEFHSLIRGKTGNNILQDYDNTYFAVGVNQSTINGLTYKDISHKPKIPNERMENYLKRIKNYFPTIHDTTTELRGDGTVPYHSLSMGETLENLDESRFAKFNTSHTGMVGYKEEVENLAGLGNCQEAELIKWVINKLSKTEKYEVQTAEPERRKYMIIRIACPVEVKVEYEGETLSSSGDDFNDRTSFGSIEFIGEKGDIKILTLKDTYEGSYNIELAGTDKGSMDYTIRYYDEYENEIGRKEFIKIPVTKDMRGYASTDENDGIIHLDYDADGDYEHSLREGNHSLLITETDKAKAATPPSASKDKSNKTKQKATPADSEEVPNADSSGSNNDSSLIHTDSDSIKNIDTENTDNKAKDNKTRQDIRSQSRSKASGGRVTVIKRNSVKAVPIFARQVAYGWNISTEGNWYYILSYDNTNRPIFKKGWHKEEGEGAWYYLNPADGKMLTGRQMIDAKPYHFRESGTSTWKYNEIKRIWEYISGE